LALAGEGEEEKREKKKHMVVRLRESSSVALRSAVVTQPGSVERRLART
jgi:hypothetical protein